MRCLLAVLMLIITLRAAGAPALALAEGETTYRERCVWCHGDRGDGKGPSAEGMIPAPRSFIEAEYKIRSTAHGRLPTDDDLLRAISNGLPGTPMPGWKETLSKEELSGLVTYIKSFSARFENEESAPLPIPDGPASVERGAEVFQKARCFMCHGKAGRGDGGITTALNFEWGATYSARDFTRGWTFKGGHEPRDIYLRITGGLNGTPMGPYADLLTDQERWDLAHYVASLDQEPSETGMEFLITARFTPGGIPEAHDAPEWESVAPVLVALAGQVVLDPPLRWWIPTTPSANARALWNDGGIAFLLEWNDPTGAGKSFPDGAFLQFAARDQSKPYFLLGDDENPVEVWRWQEADTTEQWLAKGRRSIEARRPGFKASGTWDEGRWHVIFRMPFSPGGIFASARFVPVLFSIYDGANAEAGNVRAVSTWFYTTLERRASARPWIIALACFLAAVIAEIWILSRVRR